MPDLHFSIEDVELMLNGLDALKENYNFPHYLNMEIDHLMLRIGNGFPAFTEGEIRNICLGLEELLSSDSMNWNVSNLLSRLRASIPPEGARN